MSKTKNFLKFLLNPWLLYLVLLLTLAVFFGIKPVKKLIKNTFVIPVLKQKISLNEGDYFSTDYSANTTDHEKIITTAGVIYVLGNGNVIHVIASGENIDGRIKETEETVDFIIKHEDEILDELIRTIVEAGQKSPPLEPEKEKALQNDAIKKKV